MIENQWGSKGRGWVGGFLDSCFKRGDRSDTHSDQS